MNPKEYHKQYYKDHKTRMDKRNAELRDKFPWRNSFYSARHRCTNKNNPDYANYGGRGIRFLLSMKEIKFIWFRDKAFTMKKPSIDRHNNNHNYELYNCRFIEHSENCIKDQRKPISQFTLSGKYIESYKSIKEASEKTGIIYTGISNVIRGVAKTSGGYKWMEVSYFGVDEDKAKTFLTYGLFNQQFGVFIYFTLLNSTP